MMGGGRGGGGVGAGGRLTTSVVAQSALKAEIASSRAEPAPLSGRRAIEHASSAAALVRAVNHSFVVSVRTCGHAFAVKVADESDEWISFSADTARSRTEASSTHASEMSGSMRTMA